MFRKISIVVVVALVTAGPTLAQEKFTIKLKELGQGDVSRVELIESQKFKNVTTVEKEKEPKTEENQRAKHILYTETILVRPDGQLRPTKIKRVYEKALEKSTLGPDKREMAQPYQGKSLLIEKKGDKYEFRIEGGALVEQGVMELNVEFNGIDPPQQKKTFIPPGPVTVDEIWKIDPKGFLGDLVKDGKADIIKSEGTAKLVKVYKQGDKQYGVIDATVDIHIKSKAKASPKDPEMEMKGTMNMRLEGCIDGSVADGKMTGTFQFTTRAAIATDLLGAVSNNSVGTGTIEQSWKELPKK
jgi:hypothetical protein